MKKFSVFLLSSWVLVGSSTLLALDAAQASALVRDVQEIKAKVADLARDVKQLLSLQESGASPEAAELPYTQAELLQELLRTVNKGSQAQIDDVIAKLPALGFDINHSASGGRVADAPLYRAIVTGRADVATQDKLVAAGYRLRSVDLAKLKGLSLPLSKGVQDLLAADGGGAAAAGAGK